MEYIFKKDNEKLFYEHWNALTAGFPRYSRFNIESWLLISRFKNLFADDFSFVATENKRPVACVFFPLEKHSEFVRVTIDGDYVVAPIADERHEKDIFAKIDELAREHNVASIKFLMKPTREDEYNILQKYNFLDTSVLNFRIDISGDFLKGCRKGHRCDIKRILNDKDFSLACFDAENPSREAHNGYQMLHRKQAGKVTRPQETFDLQYERMRVDKSLLAELSYKGKKIAYAYFEYEKGGEYAYYASSAGDPDYAKVQTSHAVIYAASELLRKKGIKYILVEQPASPAVQYDYYPSLKQLDIARFKRGFPGKFVMDFRGIKYYKKEAFQKDTQLFTEQYWGNK